MDIVFGNYTNPTSLPAARKNDIHYVLSNQNSHSDFKHITLTKVAQYKVRLEEKFFKMFSTNVSVRYNILRLIK